MKRQGRHEIDMCNGPLASKILLFALPLMASTMLQLLFNAADVVVVGRFAGKEALAAVGSNTSLIYLMINLFLGMSVGTNVIVAQSLGAGQMDRVKKSVHTAITLALISGTVLGIVCVLSVRWMLELVSSPTDVIDLATIYLRIYFCGLPGNLVYNFGAAILRAKGDTKRPLAFLTIAGVLNVALNLFFVVVVQINVAGVAIATIVSQYVSAGLVIRCLMKEEDQTRLDLRDLGIDWHVARRIIRVGLPAGFQSCLFSLANVVIQSGLNSFDDAALVAGASAAVNIECFVYAAVNAFTQTALTFTGQNYGAGKCERVDRVTMICQAFSCLSGLVLGNLVYIFGHTLAGLYAPGDEEVIAQAVLRLMIICCPYALCAVMDTIPGVVQGMGYSTVPMLVSLVGICGLRLLWVAFVFPEFPAPATLYISYPATWVVTTTAHVIFFFIIRKRAYNKIRRQQAAAIQPV